MMSKDVGAGGSAEDLVRELLAAYEELSVTNEELTVANEEVYVQNQELAAAREALEAERQRYHDLFHLAPDAFLVTDLHGTILEANQAAVELLGVPRGYLPRKPLAAYVRRPDLDLLYHHIARLQSGAQTATWEMRLSPRSGSAVDLMVRVSVASDSHAQPAVLHWSIQNVTDRQKAEDERETTVTLLRLANESRDILDLVRTASEFFQFKSGCDAMGIRLRQEEDYPYWETRGFPREFVLSESSLCTRDKAGRPVVDEAGNPVLECMCGNVICGRFDATRPFFTAGGSFWTNSTTELLATTSETDRLACTRNRCNHEGYESVALIPLRAGAERLGLLQLNDRRPGRFTLEKIVFWERMANHLAVALAKLMAEAQRTAVIEESARLLAQNRKLETLTAELEAYDQTVAHDLKNPLANIMGFASLLAESLEDLGEQVPREMLHAIVAGSQQMREIVDSLLQLSSTRGQAFEIGPVDMGEIVAGAQHDLAALITQNHAHITALDHWPVARGYAPWLHSVWVNYLSNALKYGGRPPRIELGAVLEPAGDQVRFWVRDHGPGLIEEQQARLFVPFVRLDRPDRLSHGLGLAIVRRIVERLGGQVGVNGRPGEGSTFWFTLPPA